MQLAFIKPVNILIALCYSNSVSYWIGVHSQNNDVHQWQYVDSSYITFSRWQSVPGAGSAQCAVVNFNSASSEWKMSVTDCSLNKHSICQVSQSKLKKNERFSQLSL